MDKLVSGEQLTERFTLIRPLGSGTTGAVWLVQDKELEEQIAVKLITPALANSTDMVDLLKAECRRARRLQHPNIVRIFDFHRARKRCFVSMQYVAGGDLSVFRGAAPSEFIDKLIAVTEALAYAHQHGVVHRDLKLSNVLLDSSGHVYLSDFGIAAAIDAEGGLELTSRGSRYSMSPQQLLRLPPTPADDAYGLGVLIYELINGAPPFYPDLSAEKIRSAKPDPLRSDHSLPSRLRGLVSRLLAKTPESRPADMKEIKAALIAVKEELGAPERPAQTAEAAVRIDPIEPIAQARRRQVARSEDRRQIMIRSVTGVVLALLLAATIGVFVFLPDWVEQQVRTPVVESEPEPEPETEIQTAPRDVRPPTPTVSVEELQRRAYEREQAETVQEQVAGLKDVLDERGAEIWGGEDYYFGVALIETADNLMRERAYDDARDTYENALEHLQNVDDNVPAVLAEKLEEGLNALAAGEGSAAAAAFSLALKIEPNNIEALTGANRAQTIEQVIELTQMALRHEAEGQLAEATTSLKQAIELDPLYLPAEEALVRVEQRLAGDAFGQAMSEGFAALEARNYRAARQRFVRAQSLRPESTAPLEGLAQVDEAIRLNAIASRQMKAEQFEAEERWVDAATEYEAVLELDSGIAFAQEGRERASARAKLDEQIQFALANPQRLSSQEVFDRVTRLVASLAMLEPAGPRLQRQRAELGRLVRDASIPIQVMLQSDNLTDVTVFKVGNLGRFTQRELTLRPGTYTVVGTRSGYRDVRHELSLVAGEQPSPLLVRCEEPI